MLNGFNQFFIFAERHLMKRSKISITMKNIYPQNKQRRSRFASFLLIVAIGFIALGAKAQTTVFYDDFSTWQGWNTYALGDVEYSSNQSFVGSYSIRKISNNDPNGGYKQLDAPMGREFSFTGRIWRPSTAGGGAQDRLAIENSNFDGYGFRVTATQVAIEKRTAGAGSDISSTVSITGGRPEDEWYRFVFTSNADNTFSVTLYNEVGTQIATVTSNVDNDYSLFDRVVVHGGYDFYVDVIQVDAQNPIITTPRSGGPGGVGNVDGSDNQPEW